MARPLPEQGPADGGDGTTLPVVVPREQDLAFPPLAQALCAPLEPARGRGREERGETDVSPSWLPSTLERKKCRRQRCDPRRRGRGAREGRWDVFFRDWNG